MQFRVGAVVLATFLFGAIIVMGFVSTGPLLKSRYTVYIKFAEAPGVTRDTPIRKAGIRIGQVSNVQLGDNDDGVIVTAEIDKDRHVYRDEECRTVSSLILGDASLEFVRLRNAVGDHTPLQNNDVIQGQIGPELTSSIAGLQDRAAKTLDTLDKTGQDMRSVLGRIDRLLATNEDKINHLIDETGETMKLLQSALAASNDIVGDPKTRAQIKQTIAEMPEILKETKTTVERMGGTFASLEQNMRNVEGLTKPLGDRGESLVNEAADSMHKLNLLTENLLRFSQQVNDSDGSLGALLHDKELYLHVTHLAKNVDELSRDLKPIVNNFEIFSDKIARHPSDLIKGAWKKDSGLKDVPADGEQPQARRWPLSGGGSWSIGQGR
jgi:phospholipid/cholesterol/gamma-HCH transport system substrate-binding protein